MEEEKGIRPPDQSRIQRLMSPPPFYDTDDDDLSLALEHSRREFFLMQQKIEQEEREREKLKQQLQLPLSRLRLWKKYASKNTNEFLFLDFIIKRVEHRLFNDIDNLPTLPLRYQIEFQEFLEKHIKNSPQYVVVYHICKHFSIPSL